MVIVVECESCHSRFRVKRTLLDGAFAIRFRCRACGGFIVVRNPETRKITAVPSPTPLHSPDSQIPAAPAALPEPEMPAVASMSASPAVPPEPEIPAIVSIPAPPAALPESEIAASAPVLLLTPTPWIDLPKVPVAPAAPPEPEMPAVASMPSSPASSGLRAIRLEDLIPCSPEEEVRAERDIIGGTGAVKRVATATRSTTFNRRAWALGILSFFAGVGIFLLASGAYDFWGSNPGGKSPGKKSSVPGSSSAATAPLKPAYDVQNLESYIPREAIAGNLFVITGTVKNVGKAPSRGIRVRATLFGKDKQALMEQASIAGNYIDKFSLPHMMRTTIESHLAAVRYEEGSVNRDIPPGKSLPFTVVYFEPPEKVEGFKVLATDTDP